LINLKIEEAAWTYYIRHGNGLWRQMATLVELTCSENREEPNETTSY